MKKVLFSIIIFSAAAPAFAQEVAEKSFWDDPINDPLLPFYLVVTFLTITAIITATVGIYLVKVLNTLAGQAEKEKAQKLGKAYVPKPSWWSKLVQRLNASVPVTEEKNIELDHNYDGIRELDNHLPPWWTWLFYGTIGWSVVYIIVFHFMHSLPLSQEEYQNELAQAEEQARRIKAARPETVIDENTLVFTQDAALIEKGKSVFMNNSCGSCHRNDGGGNNIGPNLTDAYWLHGGDIKNVFATIKNGVVEKGMPAWGKSMKPEDVRDVTFFVMSLKGTNPENAKGPQGEIFTPPTEKADTTKSQASL
ncbi:cbb3-type cytochrome c oxidase N-terminal domain-containing protein [Chryseolinea sp. H1M3-3]|uniref:cbb3-type cytochrome c oxidase N-terminal domain-containing protein n=1 Tax=Chryseolinea sp. H1M3-3 TaxID=3034144 RepID=UPI0023EADBF0|nr:cbb3-type cytochrome c oxidase N-terminal domain-containing protein [Chryseolinea sp. H1M3-3]